MRSGAPGRTPCDGDDTDSRDTCTDDRTAHMRISLLDYVIQPLRASSIHSRLPQLKQYIITNIKSKEKQWKKHFLPSCGFSMNTDSYKKSTRRVKLSATITDKYYVLLRSELEKNTACVVLISTTQLEPPRPTRCAGLKRRSAKAHSFYQCPWKPFSHKACSTFFLYDPVLHFIGL